MQEKYNTPEKDAYIKQKSKATDEQLFDDLKQVIKSVLKELTSPFHVLMDV